MANSLTSFWATVVAAASEASSVLVSNLKAVPSVYTDYRPEAAAFGQTINIPIPASRTSQVYDAGTSDVVLNDATANTKPIVFDQHPQDALLIRDFEQYNAVGTLRTLFLDGAIKGVKEHINASITGLFTSTNFSTNPVITPTTPGGLLSTTNFLAGMAALSDQKVAVTDTANMSLLLGSVPYTKMLGDNQWTEAQIAGQGTAATVRATGEMPVAYGCTVKLDQQMPVSGSAGSRTFTAAYFHRFAVAIASRPLPPPDGNVVKFMYMDFDGISIRITLGYNQYPKQGYILTVDAGYGKAVIRPEMCQLFAIGEASS